MVFPSGQRLLYIGIAERIPYPQLPARHHDDPAELRIGEKSIFDDGPDIFLPVHAGCDAGQGNARKIVRQLLRETIDTAQVRAVGKASDHAQHAAPSAHQSPKKPRGGPTALFIVHPDKGKPGHAHDVRIKGHDPDAPFPDHPL